jgi:hypothetical protein
VIPGQTGVSCPHGCPKVDSQRLSMLAARRPGRAVLLLALLAPTAVSHVDLTMVPCNPRDEQQLWTLPTPAGEAGHVIHQSTQLCLMASGCSDDARTALVLDDCKAGCLSGHRFAGTWSVENSQSTEPLAIVSSMMKKLVVDASSARFLGDPPLCLEPIDDKTKKPFTNQQWTVSPPGGGAGHTLQAGKSADSAGGYQPDCPREPCCLSVHHDLVPDGDGGWSLIVLATLALAGYLGGGVALGKWRDKRGGGASGSQRDRLAAFHPHYRQLENLVGLCRDGVTFSRGVLGLGGGGSGGGGGGARRRDNQNEPLLTGRRSSSSDAETHTTAKSSPKKKEKSAKEKRKHRHQPDGKHERGKEGSGKGKDREGLARDPGPGEHAEVGGGDGGSVDAPQPTAKGTSSAGGGRWVHVPT